MKIRELFKTEPKRVLQSGCALLLAAVLGVSSFNAYQMQSSMEVPELTSYIDGSDGEDVVSLRDDEVPLASNSKTTTKTSTKTSKKIVKLSKASTSTYSKKLATSTKVTNKTASTAKTTTKTKTTVVTSGTEAYVKNSKNKTVTTTVKTTVQTTVTTKSTVATVSVSSIAPKADARVRNAYNTLGFKVAINSGVSYSGYFSARDRSITLRAKDNTIYHELGHFLGFIAGNVDVSKNFVTIYNKEKSKYTGSNKAYVIQNSSEYFAESFKDYCLSPAALKKARPQTYAFIQASLNKVTTKKVSMINSAYSSVWK